LRPYIVAKKHTQVVDELTHRIALSDERSVNAVDECRQLHEELSKSERAESKMRVELNGMG
jgi:hypothetical protein